MTRDNCVPADNTTARVAVASKVVPPAVNCTPVATRRSEATESGAKTIFVACADVTRSKLFRSAFGAQYAYTQFSISDISGLQQGTYGCSVASRSSARVYAPAEHVRAGVVPAVLSSSHYCTTDGPMMELKRRTGSRFSASPVARSVRRYAACLSL